MPALLEKYREYARTIPIFKGLEPVEIAAILQHGETVSFPAGETIFDQGTFAANLYIILEGSVDIYNQGKHIATCPAGDAFGEMAVLNRSRRNATARAGSDVQLFSLQEKDLNTLLEKHVAVRLLLNVISVMSER
ncbi:MAG: cyclic nucleotide-binding domain-containing protein, partial [Candidatus Hydrogenedentales bacterium]